MSGKEVKKKKHLFGLRIRFPPTPPNADEPTSKMMERASHEITIKGCKSTKMPVRYGLKLEFNYQNKVIMYCLYINVLKNQQQNSGSYVENTLSLSGMLPVHIVYW